MTRLRFLSLLGAALLCQACDDRAGLQPSPFVAGTPVPQPGPQPPTPVLTGDISLRSVEPESGSKVTVRDCTPGQVTIRCADNVRLTSGVTREFGMAYTFAMPSSGAR